MNQKIIYQQEDGRLAVIMPAPNCGLTIEEIATKDVPAGVEYLIIDDAGMPEDFRFSDAWEADFSEPHGTGIGHEAWFAQQGTE